MAPKDVLLGLALTGVGVLSYDRFGPGVTGGAEVPNAPAPNSKATPQTPASSGPVKTTRIEVLGPDGKAGFLIYTDGSGKPICSVLVDGKYVTLDLAKVARLAR